jgi:HEAT repeats
MRFGTSLGKAAWLSLLAAALSAGSASAQFSASGGSSGGSSVGPPTTNDVFSSGSDGSSLGRLNRTKRGRNLNEWIRWLGDDNPARRLEAVKSLGDSNDPAAIDYLVEAVGDADPRVEAKAVDYLGKLHAADSTQFLIQKLFTVGTRDELRHRIVMTLGKIGDPRASLPILHYVEGEEDEDIRGAGIYAIGEIGDVSIRDALKRFSEVEDDPLLKRLAHEALTKIATRQPPPKPKDASPFPTALEAALSTER